MADEAAARARRVAPRQLHELARDAGPHAAGVDAPAPVLVLGRMTRSAIARGERPLEGGERDRGFALWRDGHAPVALPELLLRPGDLPPPPARGHGGAGAR